MSISFVRELAVDMHSLLCSANILDATRRTTLIQSLAFRLGGVALAALAVIVHRLAFSVLPILSFGAAILTSTLAHDCIVTGERLRYLSTTVLSPGYWTQMSMRILSELPDNRVLLELLNTYPYQLRNTILFRRVWSWFKRETTPPFTRIS